MRIFVLIVASTVLLLEYVASEEDGIKRGIFPFMAFVYYPDQTVDDGSGEKFTRSAVLVRQNWLISASLETGTTPMGFPEKTLIARLGAINIDVKFNFNEDENEQEREIIQVARPYDFNSKEWWYSDISLLKTLLPFNITATVATFATRANKVISGENCFMLVYAKHGQKEIEERFLMKISVELISPSQDKCGSNFSNDTMVCGAPTDEKNKIYTNPNFCLGNSGGPLICDNELVGTQTYIDNCNQPYLYQLLNSWDDLISCATEEKCQEEQCAKICFTINKDPLATIATPEIYITEEKKIKLADGYHNITSIDTTTTPTLTTAEKTSETVTEKTTSTTVKETQGTTIYTISTTVILSNLNTVEETTIETSDNTEREIANFQEERERKANVEAKQQVLRSDANLNTVYSFKYFLYSYLVVVVVI